MKFLRLDRHYAALRTEYQAIADRALSHGQVLRSHEVEQFEAKLAGMLGRRYAVAVGSCTDAIAFTLSALGIGPGDEVITTSYSFIATASAVPRVGARTVFVDVDDNYHLDPARVRERITPRTKALLPVNLFGDCVEFGVFASLAAEYGLFLIEDAAQSLGSKCNGQPSGSLGIASCLSFDPTKVVPSFSSAGAIVTDEEDVAKAVRCLRYHGFAANGRRVEQLGYNSQLAADKAAILAYQLKFLKLWQDERTQVAERYMRGLAEIAQLGLPPNRPGATHNWHKFVVRADRRDELKLWLQARDIECMVHYPYLLPDHPVFAAGADCYPKGRRLSESSLSLPIYPQIADDEVDYVIASVKSFFCH